MNDRKKWMLRLAGAAVCLLGVLFGGTFHQYEGFCLGDRIFSALNLPTWSNGATGTHYAGLAGMMIILAGITLINRSLQEKSRPVFWFIAILAYGALMFF